MRDPKTPPFSELLPTPNEGTRNLTSTTPSLQPATAAMDQGFDALRRSVRLRTMFPITQRLCPPRSERFWAIGGNPGNYKTVLAWNMACDMAVLRQRVLFVSLEESTGALAVKAVARYARIPVDVMERAQSGEGYRFTNEQSEGLAVAAGKLAETELYLRLHGAEEHGRTMQDILRSATRTRFDAIFVDHLRMIGRGTGRSKFEVLEDAIDKLRALAHGEHLKGYTPLVVALSPLNREDSKEGDADRLPRLSDFYGSQQIESDADVAVIVKKRPAKEDSEDPDIVDAFVLKQRGGRCPLVLQFEAQGAICAVTERRPEPTPPQHWTGDR